MKFEQAICRGSLALGTGCGKCEKCDLERKRMGLDTFSTEPLDTPTPSEGPAIWDLVMEDIHARDKAGAIKYGQRLRPDDGRDPIIDLYQELLDSVVYCRKLLYEKYRK